MTRHDPTEAALTGLLVIVVASVIVLAVLLVSVAVMPLL